MRPRVLVSAHRGGAGTDPARQNTVEAFVEAIRAGCDYVEFDVHRCGDGRAVVHHDEYVLDAGTRRPLSELSFDAFCVLAGSALPYAQALEALRDHGGRAHLDIKFTAASLETAPEAPEIEVVRAAIEALGTENLVITTGHEASARRLRDWAESEGIDLRIGLSIGRNTRGLPWRTALRMQYEDFFPARRVARSGADVVVCSHEIARLTVARWARRAELPLLVWTVDRPGALRYWLRPGRAWMVTTNHPGQALAIRRSWAGL